MTLHRLGLIILAAGLLIAMMVWVAKGGCRLEPPRYNLVVENHSLYPLPDLYLYDRDSKRDLYLGNLPAQAYCIERNITFQVNPTDLELVFAGQPDNPRTPENEATTERRRVKSVHDERKEWKGKVIILRVIDDQKLDCIIRDFYQPSAPEDTGGLALYNR